MKLLDNKNPFKPMQAEKIPRMMCTERFVYLKEGHSGICAFNNTITSDPRVTPIRIVAEVF